MTLKHILLDKILQLPTVTNRMDDKTLTEFDEASQPNLLNTIRIPQNLHFLTERLPKPNYILFRTKKVDKNKFLQTLANKESSKLNNSGFEETMIKASESVDAYKKERTEKDKDKEKENRVYLPSIGHKESSGSEAYKLMVLKEYKEKEKLEKEKLKQAQQKQQQEQGRQPQKDDNNFINLENELSNIKKNIVNKKKDNERDHIREREREKDRNLSITKLSPTQAASSINDNKNVNIQQIYGIKSFKRIDKIGFDPILLKPNNNDSGHKKQRASYDSRVGPLEE